MALFRADAERPRRANTVIVQKTWVEPRPVRELPPPQELTESIDQVTARMREMDADSKWHPNLTTLEETLSDHVVAENKPSLSRLAARLAALDGSNLDKLAACVAALTWEEMQVVAQHVAARLSAGDAKVDEYAVAASLNAWKNAWQRPEREEPSATPAPAAQEAS